MGRPSSSTIRLMIFWTSRMVRPVRLASAEPRIGVKDSMAECKRRMRRISWAGAGSVNSRPRRQAVGHILDDHRRAEGAVPAQVDVQLRAAGMVDADDGASWPTENRYSLDISDSHDPSKWPRPTSAQVREAGPDRATEARPR